MPTFKYRAKTQDGKIIDGTMDGLDKFDVVKAAKMQGLTVIFTKEISKQGFSMDSINAMLGRVKLREKIIFARNMASMLQAGISVSRTLQILEKQSRNPKFKKVLGSVNAEIETGGTLSGAMKKFPDVFSALFVAMVHSGEESGRLVESFNVVGRQLEQSYTLRKKVKGAMMYPSIVIIAMIIIGILMFIFVVPTLTSTFKEFNVKLPISTQIIMAVSEFLVAHTVMALSLIVVFVGTLSVWLRTKMGRRFGDFFVLRIPIISGIVKEYNAAQTARTLSSLFASGVSILDALSITEEVLQNTYYKEVLSKSKDVIQKGVPLSTVFLENEHIYPLMVGEMMQVGEETGKLSDMLEKIAVFYEDEVTAITKDLSTIIEPILMLFIASAVGFFAISMISPMYALTASM